MTLSWSCPGGRGLGRALTQLLDPRMEGATRPGSGAAEVWDIHSHVITETTHRTYVYQPSATGATGRWGPVGFGVPAMPVAGACKVT